MPRQSFQREDHLLCQQLLPDKRPRFARRGRSTSHSLAINAAVDCPAGNPPFVQAMLARHTSTIRYLHACSTNRTLAPSMPRQSFQREDHLLPATPDKRPRFARRGRSTSRSLAINAPPTAQQANPPFVQAMLTYVHDPSTLAIRHQDDRLFRAIPSACEQCPPTNVHDSLSPCPTT